MFFLGLLALAQMTVLPGALLLKSFPDRNRNVLESLVYAFALSLIANTILVPVLVLLHIYNATVVGTIIAAETAAWVWLKVRYRKNWTGAAVHVDGLAELFHWGSFGKSLAMILSLVTLLVYLGNCYQNWGTVFYAGDDIANWDRWACQWADGRFPTTTWLYPQLLPANWSLTYILTGTIDVKMFAKSIQTVFPLFILLLYMGLAMRHERVVHLLGLVATGWIFMHYMGPGFMTWGYADVPLAFFCFVAFYPVYARKLELRRKAAKSPDLPDPIGRADSIHWLVFLLVCGAMMVKQGAIYAFLACVGWCIYEARRSGSKVFRAPSRGASLAVGAALVSVIAWYFYKYLQIRAGTETSNVLDLVVNMHAGRSYPQRLAAAAKSFWIARGLTGPWVATPLLALYLGGLFLRTTRPIVLWLATPFLICWGLWFSYEVRTASAVLPFLGLVSGVVLARLIQLFPLALPRGRAGALLAAGVVLAAATWLQAQTTTTTPVNVPWLISLFRDMWVIGAVSLYAPWCMYVSVAVIAVCVLRVVNGVVELWWPAAVAGVAALAVSLGATGYRTELILAQQSALLRSNGNPALNNLLYTVVREKQIRSGIATGYWPLRELPEIGRLFRMITCNHPCSMIELRNLPRLLPDAGYILMPDAGLPDATRKELLAAPDLPTVFVAEGYRLLEIVRRR